MPQILDSSRTTLADHSVSLEVNQQNLKTLKPDEARVHLDLLYKMLDKTFQIFVKKLPNEGGNNPDFLNYLQKISSMLEAFVLKNRLEAARPNSDIHLSCTIDPSDSGFPVVVRDFKFLTSDKNQVEQELAKLPEDEKLVDDALFVLFRGLFPKDVVLKKMTRNYYELLSHLTLAEPLKIYEVNHIKEEQDAHYCTQSFERLDDHSNIPRFYTLYLRIPSKTYPKPEWQPEIKQAIETGLSTVTNLELGYLAKKIEEIEGVQLECLERFDIGPFYSQYTNNGETVNALLESEKDCIMMFSKSMVVRTGEEERTGIREKFLGWWSGDEHIGHFSPAINSPQYILMPHRLIQKVHNLKLTLKEHTKMYGITSTGELYE